ncbi:MAG: phytanoyl-CoA dioxygenase family protein [Devosia sp.]
MDEYLFDLNGYLVIRNVLTPAQLAGCNATLDALPRAEGKSWAGNVYVDNPPGKQEGLVAQQIYEGGPAWEELIDHPAWMKKIVHFLGTDVRGSFDAHHGPAFIDEAFASVRGPGKSIPLHSSGYDGVIRCQYRYHAGVFHCGQVNVLMAFNDIGPGDGATMVIPGSHKSNIQHPQRAESRGRSVEGIEGAIEVYLKAGDALMFVDAIMHGSAQRVNEGERRMAVYRYGPSWGRLRLPFEVSAELLARLTPERRAIVEPVTDRLLPPERRA